MDIPVITGTTQLLGVIGDPVEHSLSPVMHNAAIAQLGANFVYLPLPVPTGKLAIAIAGFEAIGLKGFNITIPHKQTIMPLLAGVSDIAQAVGAVNTVWWEARGWQGTNTDVAGFIAPLQLFERSWSKTIALVLGNGGAARAVVAGCTQLGCTEVWVVGRRAEKLNAFAESWQRSPIQPPLTTFTWDKLPELLPKAGLVVNTTPVGMHPKVDACPLMPDEMAMMQSGAIAYDLIYTPSPTQFLQQAKDKGAIAIDGLEMLVQQGAAALSLWLDRPAPVAVMRQALKAQLNL
ncbi:MAG: shikimate dehydrogenase [Cyanobacteria bacterium J06635_15]